MTTSNKNLLHYLHYVIGVIIMIGFRYLPTFNSVTPEGMMILGIFIGAIYMWSTVGLLWPSLIGLLVLGVSMNGTAGLLPSTFGSETLILVMFVFIIFGVIGEYGFFDWATVYLLSRKSFRKNPWFFCFMLFFVGGILSAFSSAFVMIAMYATLLKGICNTLEIGNGKFYKIMFIGSVYILSIFSVLTPFTGMSLALVSMFKNAININPISYIAVSLPLSVACILFYMFLMRFVFKIDISPIKAVDIEKVVSRQGGMKLSKDQMFVGGVGIGYLFILAVQALLGNNGILGTFLSALGTGGITILAMIILAIARDSNNKSYLIMARDAKHIGWDVVILLGFAGTLSGYLTADNTGIVPMILSISEPLLEGKSPYIIVAIIAAMALILTNFANNFVICIVTMNLGVIFSSTYNLNSSVLLLLVLFTSIQGIFVPSAGGYAGMLYGDDWIEPKDVYKYAGLALLGSLIVTLVMGIPLAHIIL